jgi:Fungal chitosanase of glycosyl hydrolase group 75
VATGLRSHRLTIHGLTAYSLWSFKGAVLFRRAELSIDWDGALNAYHPPVYPHPWDGKGPGLGKDSLLNAAGNWRDLIAGCPAHGHGHPKVPHAAHCPAVNPQAWTRAHWVGIQHDAHGPKIQQHGRYQGFYMPSIVPVWADAEQHPWVVQNPRLQEHAGVNLGNRAVVVLNGDPPRVAYAMVADSGPRDKLGEVSIVLLDQLQLTEGSTSGKDFIVVMFPARMDTNRKTATEIIDGARNAFGAWGGVQTIEALFPTPARYLRLYNEYHEHLLHSPGGLPPLPPIG